MPKWARQCCMILLALAATACDHDGGQGIPMQRGAWLPGREWRLVPEATIGSVDQDGYEFGNVVGVALDPLGRVWVADGKQSVVRVFDAGGKLVRSVGRKGRGPNEFLSISGMTFDPSGRLWVVDGGNARYTVYDTAGKLVKTAPRVANMSATPWPGRFDDAGRLYDVSGTLAPDGAIVTYIVRLDSALQPADTFAVPPLKEEVFQIVRGDKRNRITEQVVVPFTGTQTWKLDPEGFVWIANTARYRIERHGFTGGARQVVEHATEPVRVTRQERDRMLDGYKAFIDRGGKIDVSRVPKTHPALTNYVIDDAGRLWVSVVTSEREGRVLDVFELNGRFLGRVPLPTGMRSGPRAIRGDRMVVVATDSLDVQSVVLLRIVKPGG